jgi:hypothetical protein
LENLIQDIDSPVIFWILKSKMPLKLWEEKPCKLKRSWQHLKVLSHESEMDWNLFCSRGVPLYRVSTAAWLLVNVWVAPWSLFKGIVSQVWDKLKGVWLTNMNAEKAGFFLFRCSANFQSKNKLTHCKKLFYHWSRRPHKILHPLNVLGLLVGLY